LNGSAKRRDTVMPPFVGVGKSQISRLIRREKRDGNIRKWFAVECNNPLDGMNIQPARLAANADKKASRNNGQQKKRIKRSHNIFLLFRKKTKNCEHFTDHRTRYGGSTNLDLQRY
jgi:hypothetical protein